MFISYHMLQLIIFLFFLLLRLKKKTQKQICSPHPPIFWDLSSVHVSINFIPYFVSLLFNEKERKVDF